MTFFWKKQPSIANRMSGFIFGSILILAVFVILANQLINQKFTSIDQKMEQKMQEKTDMQNVSEQFQQTVIAFRAYVVLDNRDKLADYQKEQATMDEMFKEMNATLASDPSKKEKAALSAKLLTQWQQYTVLMQDSAKAKQENTQTAAGEKAITEKRTAIYNQMIKDLNTLTGIYSKEVDDVLAEKKTFDRGIILIPIIMLIGSAATGWLLIGYMRKWVLAPVLKIEETVRRIAGGEYLFLDELKREDELGRLQQGINTMTTALTQRRDDLEQTYKELLYQRDMLEAQNEEIIAQQDEQHETLEKLTERENELETLSSYLGKLSGYTDLPVFLENALPALLDATRQDAAIVVRHDPDAGGYHIIYSIGYPQNQYPRLERELYGPASRVFAEKRPISTRRTLSLGEQGLHSGYMSAVDQYFPLLNDKQEAMGFLLLTTYGTDIRDEKQQRVAHGLIKQFSLAFYAQLINEERKKQAIALSNLHAEVLQEKHAISVQRNLITSILESTREGILLCNQRGEVAFASQQMRMNFGREDMVGKQLLELCRQLDTKLSRESGTLCEVIGTLLSEETDFVNERFMLRKESEAPRHFELYARPVTLEQAGMDKGFLFVIRDRTEEEKIDELKNEFVSIVSHELRTPLATILGFMEILLNRDVQADKQKKYMQTIFKEANRLSTLINDFLDLQRMESGRQVYHFAPVDLRLVVEEVAEQWNGKQSHAIHLELPDGPAYVYADHDRLTQVLHNLVSNALKYSPAAECIDIRLRRGEGQLLLEIQDYGLGIPADSIDKLFTKFFRVDNSDRRQIGGTGLGLAIVKEILDVHKGKITFRPGAEKGSIFTIELKEYIPRSIGGKILILEDDDSLARLMYETIEKLELPIILMKSAEEASMALESEQGQPLLCIVDIQLEGAQSGWDFIAKLNRHPDYHPTPVIVTTVLEPPVGYHETEKAKYVKKPFAVEWLLQVVMHLLKQNQPKPHLVFPFQDETAITMSLMEQGIHVADLKVKEDIIEVDVKKVDEPD
ncbi:UNVERIFIED_CONTAM: signal transduction histidine kinase/DNA-binding response OmpR family regulator [Brevibacillus sp. OAP136]